MKIFFIALGSVIVLMLLGISCEIANRINTRTVCIADPPKYGRVIETPKGKIKIGSNKPISDEFVAERERKYKAAWGADAKPEDKKDVYDPFEAEKRRKESILVSVVRDMCSKIKSIAKEVFIGRE